MNLRRLLPLLFLLGCAQALGAGSIGQCSSATNGNSAALDSAGTSIVSAAITVTAGNNLFIWVHQHHGSALQTVSLAGNSNTYSEIGTGAYNGANGYGDRIFYAQNVNGGSTTVTATYGASVAGTRAIVVCELTGTAPTGTLVGASEYANQNQVTYGTSANAVTSGSATPAQQPALVIAVCTSMDQLNVLSAGTGFNTANAGANVNWGYGGNQALIESQRITSTSALAGTCTASTGSHGTTVMAIFRETAAVTIPARMSLLGVGK